MESRKSKSIGTSLRLTLVFATLLFGGTIETAAERPGSVFSLEPLYGSSEFLLANTLAVNESKTVTVSANKEHNWTGVKLINGQTFKFTVGSPAWNNGSIETDAEGYLMPVTPPGWVLRFPNHRVMALVGSLYTYQDKYSYTGTSFLIAKGRTWKATKTGFVAAFANDCEGCYGDNSRVVTLTIKRVE